MSVKERRKNNLKLIELAQQGDKAAAEELMEINEAFINHILRSMCLQNPGIADDIFQEGRIGLYKAIMTYDAGKNVHFTSYAAVCIKNQAKMLLRHEKRHGMVISLESESCPDDERLKLKDTIPDPKSLLDMIDDDNLTNAILEVAKKYISPTNFQVFLARVLSPDNPSQREVGDALGIGRSYVSRKEKESIEVLKSAIVDEFESSDKECFRNLALKLAQFQRPNAFMERVLGDERKISLVKSLMPTILTPHQAKIIEGRYFTVPPKSRLQIAQEEGLLYEQVYRQEKTALTKLKKNVKFDEQN